MILTQIVVTVWVNFTETNRNTAVCKFLRFKDKYEVLQNIKKKLKNTGIFIYENFSKATMEPLLFLIYVNDLCNVSNNGSTLFLSH